MKTILVAEDNAVNRELIREILESSGYKVIETTDGNETWDKLQEISVDLVLMDIQMPFADGFEVIRRLRADARFADLRVIALTAFAMAGDKEKMLAAGFNGYLAKPIDFAAFTKAVRQALDE